MSTSSDPIANISDVELAGYLDELLPTDRAVAVETALRESPALRQRVSGLIRERDQGGHTIGEIWRRQRLSCPTRSDLGAFLMGVMEPARADYVRFHIHEIGCRFCEANLVDLETAAKQADTGAEPRRQRFFESSAGRLKGQ
jgi:hypothetical protein